MKKTIKAIFTIIIIFHVNSCDILRTTPFDVASWSPGGGYHAEPEKIIISAEFSSDPDCTSVERYFSLTADSGHVKGNFRWEGRKMTFIPLSPLEKNSDYTLNISAEAHNTKGLNMDEAFDVRFSTRPGKDRPVLLSCYPEMYAEVDDARTEVQLRFSLPVALKTLYENVSFNPSMTGSWRLEEEGLSAVFTPSEPWMQNNRYEIRLSSDLTDYKNMNIGKSFSSIFTVGTDHKAPSLLYAGRVSKNGDIAQMEADESSYVGASRPIIENEGWEKDDKLLLVFSKPVDGFTVKNCLNADGASGFVMENTAGFNTEFIFYFDVFPVFESRFVIKINSGIKDFSANEDAKEYIYRIFANGKYSKPPELIGIRLPMAPENDSNKELISFGMDSLFEFLPICDDNEHYPSKKGINTWIEFYFDVAEGASIDQFSLMELFRIETSNNVLAFSSRQLITDNFSTTEPQPGWGEYYRMEIKGILTNSVYFGIVNFQIASGLKDNLGNKNEKTFKISTVK